MPRPGSDHAGLRIDLNWGRGAVTLGSGVGRSPVLVPDRIPATTDRPIVSPNTKSVAVFVTPGRYSTQRHLLIAATSSSRH